MEAFSDILVDILGIVVLVIATIVGRAIKKYIDTDAKAKVVNAVVNAVEQLYKDLHGEDKYNKAVEHITELLNAKGLGITEDEMRILIEAAVNKINQYKLTELVSLDDAVELVDDDEFAELDDDDYEEYVVEADDDEDE